jgi:hypothetical protein
VAAPPPVDAEPVEHPRPLDPFHAELITGLGAALLLVSLRFLPWFGVAPPPGGTAPRALTTVGAWQALTWLRWPLMLAIVVALVPLLARPVQRWIGLPRVVPAAVTALGVVAALLLAYRVLIDLPEPSRVVDQQPGAILGLLGALVVALGGVEMVRAHAAQRRARKRVAGARHESRTRRELARARA